MQRVISVEPFGAAFTLVLGDRSLSRLAKRLDTDLEAGANRAAVYKIQADGEAAVMIMHLPEERDEELVWHEALHMATALLDIHGVEISHSNDEVMAYLQGSIVREVDKVAYRRGVNRTKRKSRLE
jgi:hypothetical protein